MNLLYRRNIMYSQQPYFLWLGWQAMQAIVAAFGQRDGKAVINATNAYLNQLAANDRDKATALAGFINQHPLDAALYGGLYVQDGLVFQMDRAYECTAAKWTDFIGGVEFIGTNVQIADDAPYFNGTNAYMQMSSIHHYDWNTHTVEVVLKNEKTGFNPILADKQLLPGTIAVVLRNNMLCWVQSTSNMAAYTDTSDIGFKTLSFNKERGYKNTNQLAGRSGDTLGHDIDYIVLGARHYNNAYSGFYQGYLYSIRIYNRLLTEAEILANQEIDLKRFTPSTP